MADAADTIAVPETRVRPWRLPRAVGLTLRFCGRKPLGAIGAVAAEHHAVVQGLVARGAGLTPEDAARLPGASLLAGAASAIARLLPVDTADAMAVDLR